MKIRDLAQEEHDNLKLLAQAFTSEVEKVLSKMRHEKVRLFLPENEQYRLLKLRVWTEIYSVDLKYILERLLPFWQQFVRKRTKRIRSEGLGVRVGTLTGKKSAEMLRNFIIEDFPAGQNEILRRAHLQEKIISRILDSRSKNEIKTTADVARGVLDFPDPKGYLQYYNRRIRKLNEAREDIIEEMIKRPFRGNPFL